MKRLLAIQGIHAVGMHHYGSRSLIINAIYEVKREPSNRYDANACVIIDKSDKQTCAYINRKSARTVSIIMDSDLLKNRHVYIKPKHEATVTNRSLGPEQHCYLAFYVGENEKDEIDFFLKTHNINFYYHTKS